MGAPRATGIVGRGVGEELVDGQAVRVVAQPAPFGGGHVVRRARDQHVVSLAVQALDQRDHRVHVPREPNGASRIFTPAVYAARLRHVHPGLTEPGLHALSPMVTEYWRARPAILQAAASAKSNCGRVLALFLWRRRPVLEPNIQSSRTRTIWDVFQEERASLTELRRILESPGGDVFLDYLSGDLEALTFEVFVKLERSS